MSVGGICFVVFTAPSTAANGLLALLAAFSFSSATKITGISTGVKCFRRQIQPNRISGTEDSTNPGRIASLLYPDANIQIKGFEKTDYPNDFFDVVIGNVPFGAYKVNDRQYEKYNFFIHDYFLAKSLDNFDRVV